MAGPRPGLSRGYPRQLDTYTGALLDTGAYRYGAPVRLGHDARIRGSKSRSSTPCLGGIEFVEEGIEQVFRNGSPSVDDVGDDVCCTFGAHHLYSSMPRFQDSLDHVQDAENGLRLVDIVPDAGATVAFDRMEWEDIRRHLDGCCRALDQRERTILELYFGEDMTLAEIGALLGVSEARISQLRRATLQRLSATIDSDLRRAA